MVFNNLSFFLLTLSIADEVFFSIIFGIDAVEQIHNVDVATTYHGEPSAQVCDLLLNKNGKLYIATSSQNPFFKDLIKQPKVIVNDYKGNGTMD